MKKMKLKAVQRNFFEKVYQNKDGFHYPQFGKTNPNLTFILPENWYVDEIGSAIDPYELQSCPKFVLDNLSLQFNDVYLRWGKYKISKNGKPCFRLTTIAEATHVFLQVYWKGSPWFFQYRNEESIKKTGAVHYKLARADGHSGYEYFVFPVDLLSMEDLALAANEELIKLKEGEKKYYENLKNRKDSIKNKPIFEGRLIECNKKLETEALPLINMTDDQFSYNLTKYYYTEENCNKIEKLVKKKIEEIEEKRKKLEQHQLMVQKFNELLEKKNLKKFSKDMNNFLIIKYNYSLKDVLTEKFEYTEEGLKKLEKFEL